MTRIDVTTIVSGFTFYNPSVSGDTSSFFITEAGFPAATEFGGTS
jgi:hypothetical protein